jgi:hypothetical protein
LIPAISDIVLTSLTVTGRYPINGYIINYRGMNLESISETETRKEMIDLQLEKEVNYVEIDPNLSVVGV